MSIQLIITAEHSTNLAAELRMLAEALFPTGSATGLNISEQFAKYEVAPGTAETILPGVSVVDAHNGDIEKTEKPKRNSRRKKADEPANAITVTAQGEIDLFEEELVPVPAEKVFIDPPKTTVQKAPVPAEKPKTAEDKIINHDALKDLIQTVGKNDKGDTDPAKYAQMRNIMKSYVPVGTDVKIPNIPAEKVKEVYYQIAAL